MICAASIKKFQTACEHRVNNVKCAASLVRNCVDMKSAISGANTIAGGPDPVRPGIYTVCISHHLRYVPSEK